MKCVIKGFWVLGLLSLLILVNTSCSGTAQTIETQSGSEAVERKKSEKPTVDAFGVIKANNIKNISVSFPTVIQSVDVKEGQRVKKGDLLLSLNTTEIQEQIKSREAELENEEKLLLKKQANPDSSKLQNDLKSAEDLYNKDLKELSNKESLFKSGSISQYDLDEFKKVVDAKKKAIDDIKYSIASNSLNSASDKDISATKISTLISDIKILKDKLNRSYLKENSIICDLDSGLVINMKLSPGYVVREPQVLFDIVDLSSLIALADVDEGFIKEVQPGAKVKVIPLADRSRSFDGEVIRISDKAIVKNGQTFIQVEVNVADNDNFLQLDYNVDVKIAKE